VFAIKPSGIPYEKLSPKDMVIVDFDGETVEGILRPSSDTQTHAILYKYWNKIYQNFLSKIKWLVMKIAHVD
jgi:L-ribulose-5-phosphate 4-epimerase